MMKRLLLMDDFLNWDPEEIDAYCYLDASHQDADKEWHQLLNSSDISQKKSIQESKTTQPQQLRLTLNPERKM
jgi:hypothetical protein